MRGVQYYIAAAWSDSNNIPLSFTVGDGETFTVNGVNYVNIALNSGTSYALLVRVDIESDNDQPLIQYSEKAILQTPLSYSPAGVAIGVLLIIAAAVVGIVVVVVVWWYR